MGYPKLSGQDGSLWRIFLLLRKTDGTGIDADENAAGAGARRTEDVEELRQHHHAKRERRGHSRENQSDGDRPGQEATYRSWKPGSVRRFLAGSVTITLVFARMSASLSLSMMVLP